MWSETHRTIPYRERKLGHQRRMALAIVAYKGGGQFSGGTLIAKKWVLTVSHCVNDTNAGLIVTRLAFSLA